MTLSPPVYVVFWRKRWHSGSCRKYVSVRGFTEDWKLAIRYADKGAADIVAKRINDNVREVFVVEETRELPKPTPTFDWKP